MSKEANYIPKYIKVHHKAGKHLSDFRSFVYVTSKLLFAKRVTIQGQVGGNAYQGYIPDWQKIGGFRSFTFDWKKFKLGKKSETLVAYRNFAYESGEIYRYTYSDDRIDACEYRRDPNHNEGKHYTLNEASTEDSYLEFSKTIERRRGEWMVAYPWVEGRDAGSTLDHPITYYVRIKVVKYLWTDLLDKIRGLFY